jgi:hypothetical protein
MSSGHDVSDWTYADVSKVERVTRLPEVESRLAKFVREDDSYDLPYLAGYSIDGTTIYFDRHLPEWLECETDRGGSIAFEPRQFIRLHEEYEKAIKDALGWHYLAAHEVANGVERRAVIMAGLSWRPYGKVINQFIKADEVEKLERVPPDLDMAPYYAPPVNRKLIKAMQKAGAPAGDRSQAAK